jgi:hypothetical protein
MKRNKLITYLFIPVIFISVCCFSSCWFLDPASELYRIQVDSISAPGTVNFNTDTVVIKFWGKIGDDTCHSFQYFQGVQDSLGIELALWGYFNPAYRKGCPGADVQLAGREFRVMPQRRGNFTITIRQPDGTVLKKFVDVN